MIYKNGKIGEVEGVTVCVFGSGDIDVSTGQYEKGGHLIIFTNMKEPIIPIGTELVDRYAKSTDELGIDVVFEFNKIESVDVVISALEGIKERMTQ